MKPFEDRENKRERVNSAIRAIRLCFRSVKREMEMENEAERNERRANEVNSKCKRVNANDYEYASNRT